MKRSAKIATGSITALAAFGANYAHPTFTRNRLPTTPAAATDSYHEALKVISQAVVLVIGPVDTASAITNTDGGGGTAQAPTPAPPAGEHSGTRIDESPDYIPPAPSASNPFVVGTGDNCVTIALPISGTQKQYCGDDANGGVIMVYAKEIAKLLSGSIGGVIVLMIVISGIQYILSAGSSSRVQAAKSRLTNAIIALVLFLMAFAIINFIVPGGIITG